MASLPKWATRRRHAGAKLSLLPCCLLWAGLECAAQSDDGAQPQAPPQILLPPELEGENAAEENAALDGEGIGEAAGAAQVEETGASAQRGVATDEAGEDERGEGDSVAAAAPPTRLETLLDFNRLAEDERYEDALPLGQQLLELTEQEFGAESLQTAEAYESVAEVQRQAKQHELAEENFLHAVSVIRTVEGSFSERAIRPLIGLGDNYHDSGEYLNAVTAYNEARTINRRAFGLLNEQQIPILDRITDSLQQLDQYQEADAQQLTILGLAERTYPVGSPEYLDGLYRYAAWLRESGRYNEERAVYARAQRIIRDLDGKESLLLVEPLREIGNSFRSQRIPEGQGISSLRSALELLEMPGRDNPLALAEVLRDIGDWEVAFSKVDPDLGAYRRAWELLGQVEGGEELRREWFDDLENVLGEPISQRGLSRDPDAPAGYVVVQFDVDRFGRTANVAVARSDPPGLKDDAVARAVRRWRFRPFMSDGEIVAKDGLALQFNYRYLPNEDEDA